MKLQTLLVGIPSLENGIPELISIFMWVLDNMENRGY